MHTHYPQFTNNLATSSGVDKFPRISNKYSILNKGAKVDIGIFVPQRLNGDFLVRT